MVREIRGEGPQSAEDRKAGNGPLSAAKTQRPLIQKVLPPESEVQNRSKIRQEVNLWPPAMRRWLEGSGEVRCYLEIRANNPDSRHYARHSVRPSPLTSVVQ